MKNESQTSLWGRLFTTLHIAAIKGTEEMAQAAD